MKSMTVVLFLAVAAVVSARPQFNVPRTLPGVQLPGQVVPLLERDEVRHDSGEYTLRYVTGDNIIVTESGKLVPNDEGDDVVLIKEGSYTFTSPEGQTYTVSYISDRNGFRPAGEHLPVSVV